MLKATWFVLAGMGIVFATLTILILAMIALNWLLTPTPEFRGHAERRHVSSRQQSSAKRSIVARALRRARASRATDG